MHDGRWLALFSRGAESEVALGAAAATAGPFPPFLVTLLALLPLALLLASASFTLLSRAFPTPKWLRTAATAVAPFVTAEDVRQTFGDLSAGFRADPGSNAGFRRQGKRIRTVVALTLMASLVWAIRSGWTIAASPDSVEAGVLAGVNALTWAVLTVCFVACPPETPPVIPLSSVVLVFMSASVRVLEHIPDIASGVRAHPLLADILDWTLSFATMTVMLAMPVSPGGYEAKVGLPERIRLERGDVPAEQEDLKLAYSQCATSPEDYASLIEVLTYTWMNPIQALALKRPLVPSDIWRLRSINDSRLLHRNFHSSRGHSLLRRLIHANLRDIIKDFTFKTIGVSFMFAGPALMKSILDCISLDASESSTASSVSGWTPRQKAFVLACVAMGVSVVRFLAELANFHAARQVGLRVRSTLVVECFEKALKRRDLSGSTHVAGDSEQDADQQRGADAGKIVNLISSDINVLLRMGCDLHQIYGSPAEVLICSIFLYRLLGWSAMVGMSLLVAAMPLTWYLGNRNFSLQQSYSVARDRRISLMAELIAAIKMIKLQGGESQWRDRVLLLRDAEMRALIYCRINSFCLELLWTVVPILVTIVTFALYVTVQGQHLTVAVAFVGVTLFQMVRVPLNVIPTFVTLTFQALVSVGRLEAFLAEEEVEPRKSNSGRDVSDAVLNTLSVRDGCFEWQRSTGVDLPAFRLVDINITFPETGLCVIAGATGSGKSSLLSALLGEMRCTSGTVVRPSRRPVDKSAELPFSAISYASQTPWLEAGKSLRSNVLFYAPFDRKRYESVLEGCALLDDLAEMPDGDATRVSTHTLSGGQKARLALARALYASSQTVLLDDVLSAVDTRVQKQLYLTLRQSSLVANRRIVLVTHHHHLVLPGTDFLVAMSAGRVVAAGSPADLKSQGLLEDVLGRVDLQERSASDAEKQDGLHVSPLAKAAANGDPQEESGGEQSARLLYELEQRREGSVRLSYWRLYFRSASTTAWTLIFLLTLAFRLAATGEQYWLKRWGESYGRVSEAARAVLPELPGGEGHERFWLGIYALIGLVSIVLNASKIGIFYLAAWQASRRIYNQLLSNVVRAPIRFFVTNPKGRLLQRFTGDVAITDNDVPQNTMNALNNLLALGSYLAVCLVVTPAFLIPALALFLSGPYLVGGFLAATRDMQRIISTSTSPMYDAFQEALSGITVIRAFGAEHLFLDQILTITSITMSQWWCRCTIEIWLSFRAQILGGMTVFIVTLLALWVRASPGSAGMAISSAALLTQITYYLVNDWKQLNNNLNAVERIAEYMDMPQEAPAIIPSSRPPAAWPSRNATIRVEDLSLRYAPDLPDVLHGVSFTVRPREKLGIVGRTGSGKTTLASAFFRSVEPSGGRIVIDDIDIGSVGLDDLRKRLSIVAQDPVLLSGSVRENVDPFNEYSDEEVLGALRRVQITATRSSASANASGSSTPLVSDTVRPEEADKSRMSLDTPVAMGGANFSAGQAQLLSLARALLRNSRIIILDEASSSLDVKTDLKIQQAIRSLDDAIVIGVAHRLATVIFYDRILVLSSGRIVELDTPHALLSKADGPGAVFKAMCREAGAGEYAALRAAAGLGPE